MMLTTALTCLALNIHHEARAEPVMGRYSVAMVTMNRAGWDDEKVCDTVFRRKQFSWANGHAKKINGVWHISAHLAPKVHHPVEREAWERSQIIAGVVLQRRMHDITGGADHYHADYIRKPVWTRGMEKVKQVGRHIFYRQA